jgi:hypothetical protein
VRGIVLWDREDPAPPELGWGKKRLELVG